LSASRPACREVWYGSGRRTRTDTRLVPQCPNPHLGRLSLRGAILYHVIRWSVHYCSVTAGTPTAPSQDPHHHLVCSVHKENQWQKGHRCGSRQKDHRALMAPRLSNRTILTIRVVVAALKFFAAAAWTRSVAPDVGVPLGLFPRHYP